MKYIIIESQTETSKVRAEKINRELYKISRPTWSDDDVTKYFLTTYENGGIIAFGFEDTDFLPVANEVDVTTLKNLLSEDATQAERDMLGGYITSKIGEVILFKDIIPSTITQYTKTELENLGWTL